MTDHIPDPNSDLGALEREHAADVKRLQPAVSPAAAARVWERVEARAFGRGQEPSMHASASGRKPQGVMNVHPRKRAVWSRAVAGVAIVGALVVGGVAFLMRNAHLWAPVAPARTYATTARQRATITLSDGSRVVLAPQSALTVAGDFGRDARTVSLVGEAYFDVVGAARSPFIVHAGDVSAQVLGTSFSVQRYRDDRETHIAVASGKVVVHTTDNPRARVHRSPIVLLADMVGTITDSSVTAASVRDLTPYTGWANGQLVIHDTPIAQALVVLGRWYGYEFRLQDSALAGRHLTNAFDPNAPEEMLAALKTILDVSMTFDGNVVTLQPRRTEAQKAAPRDTERRRLGPQFEREVGRE